MDMFSEIQHSLGAILDIEIHDITPETYIVRDLMAESIDLLELSVDLNSRFKVEIRDDEIFLRAMRLYINEAKENGGDVEAHLCQAFPFLDSSRVSEILADLENGPVLKMKDLVAYLLWECGKTTKHGN